MPAARSCDSKKKKINILIYFYNLNIIIMYNILHIIKKFTTTMIG